VDAADPPQLAPPAYEKQTSPTAGSRSRRL
jgi:hypothetical protein